MFFVNLTLFKHEPSTYYAEHEFLITFSNKTVICTQFYAKVIESWMLSIDEIRNINVNK